MFRRANIGYVFWFFAGIVITLVFYHPFEQPLISDRAYLVYISQSFTRDSALYSTTTFGYTPLSVLTIGILMKISSVFSIGTILTARLFGIVFYGLISGSIFSLARSVFKNIKLAHLTAILFCGMGYIQILSGINAEPKLWVLLFSILGMQAFYNQKWFLTGLFFCLAAMSWQVAVVSLFACFLCLPWRSERLWKSLTRLAAGVLSGIIPIVLYLTITNQWVDFWDLAVLRKLVVEGEQVGESPLSWIRKGIYPHFLLEGFHFLLSLGGIVVVFINMIRKKGPGKNSSENRFLIFLIIYSIFWSGFNTLDFQSAADLLPLIPAVIFFGAIMLRALTDLINHKVVIRIALGTFLVYNFFDAVLYRPSFSFSEQKQLMRYVENQFQTPIAVGFEEYYVLADKQLPTRFVRLAPYEDHLIQSSAGGCEQIIKTIKTAEYNAVIELNRTKRQRSESTQKLLGTKALKKVPAFRGECTDLIISQYCTSNPIDSLKVKIQSIPFGGDFYVIEHYDVWEFSWQNDQIN